MSLVFKIVKLPQKFARIAKLSSSARKAKMALITALVVCPMSLTSLALESNISSSSAVTTNTIEPAKLNNNELSKSRQKQLLHLLKQDCGSCHGMTLKGGLGPALLPENLDGKPQLFLENTIYYGRPGTAMPPWQGILSKEEVSWLTEQLVQGIENEK